MLSNNSSFTYCYEARQQLSKSEVRDKKSIFLKSMEVKEPIEISDICDQETKNLSTEKHETAQDNESSIISVQDNKKVLLKKYREVYSSKPKGLMIKLINLLKSDLIDSTDALSVFPQFSKFELDTVKDYLIYKKKSREFTVEEDELLLTRYSNENSKSLLKLFSKRCLRQLMHRYHYLINNNSNFKEKVIINQQKPGTILSINESSILILRQLNEKSDKNEFSSLPFIPEPCNSSIENLLFLITAWVPQMKDEIESLIKLNRIINQELVCQFNFLLETLMNKVKDKTKPFEDCKKIFENVMERLKGIESLCCGKLQNILLMMERSFIKKKEKGVLSLIHVNQINKILQMKLNQIESIRAMALEEANCNSLSNKN